LLDGRAQTSGLSAGLHICNPCILHKWGSTTSRPIGNSGREGTSQAEAPRAPLFQPAVAKALTFRPGPIISDASDTNVSGEQSRMDTGACKASNPQGMDGTNYYREAQGRDWNAVKRKPTRSIVACISPCLFSMLSHLGGLMQQSHVRTEHSQARHVHCSKPSRKPQAEDGLATCTYTDTSCASGAFRGPTRGYFALNSTQPRLRGPKQMLVSAPGNQFCCLLHPASFRLCRSSARGEVPSETNDWRAN
jgi:hypothetical protein